ncbi:cbb3-type cytochrome oxidase assembly protein CcoS [Aequorivita xiaoshiensis]|uniref:Cbb3-type cytochrome oxidase assembly protein CcoS n=1 Tax=Aequorivita xiaoshiensis TaxID=2874476 RepID=A0A9X1U515_9FLAO|nr:cbb3-type cytochrome oxidase assembly protein CcoS [Aequorivita xiaoshiensis]MCG2431520.1 cbb3-type cytochrome oxidase assembly protein CcoS [Aequorivita xiaoshiensis]
MTIIYMLLALSLLVAIIFFVLFIFSVRKGQYDDTYTPSVRMLFDDELVKEDAELTGDNTGKKLNKTKVNLTNPEK